MTMKNGKFFRFAVALPLLMMVSTAASAANAVSDIVHYWVTDPLARWFLGY
jgi:hypothetical protein